MSVDVATLRVGRRYRLTLDGGYELPDGAGWTSVVRPGDRRPWRKAPPLERVVIVREAATSTTGAAILYVARPESPRRREILGGGAVLAAELVS